MRRSIEQKEIFMRQVNRRHVVIAVVLLVAAMCCPELLHADDWPQFLGPVRNGTSAETGLLGKFPAGGPQVLWKTPLGVGMSGVAVQRDSLLTMFQDDATQYVACLNSQTGKLLWKTAVDPTYLNAMGNGPRATPTIVGELAYALTGGGSLVSVNLNAGEVRWKTELTKAVSGKSAEYGNASSPLVVDDVVIVQFDGADCCVVACHAKTGKVQWQAGAGTAGYSSPTIMTLNGTKQVVVFAGSEVLGLSPADGSVLWQHPYVTDYDCNIATPLRVGEDRVLVSSGENHGSEILEIAGDPAAMTARSVWKSQGKTSVLRAEWQTPLLLDGHLYALDNSGSAGPITNLVCVRLSDGKQLWNERRFGKSNFTFADGNLYFSTMKGELVVGTVDPDGFTETARHSLLEMTRQAPVIANGLLYQRDDKHVLCLDLREAK
jgi:outer membrane protein assembly factor BamB